MLIRSSSKWPLALLQLGIRKESRESEGREESKEGREEEGRKVRCRGRFRKIMVAISY